MKQIYLYIAKEFFFVFLVCFLSSFVVFYISMLLNQTVLLSDGNVFLFFERMLHFLPLTIDFVFPMSCLLSTVVFLFLLSRHSEITAMISAGLTKLQIIGPIFVMIGFFSILFYLNQSYLTPFLGYDSSFIGGIEETTAHWFAHDKQLYYLKEGTGLIIQLNSKGKIQKQIKLQNLHQQGNTWVASHQDMIEFKKQGEIVKTQKGKVVFTKKEYPYLFPVLLQSIKYTSFENLWTQWKKATIKSKEKVKFAIYSKISSILSLFLLSLMVVPFSFFKNRRTISYAKVKITTAFLLSIILMVINVVFLNLFINGMASAFVAGFSSIFVVIAITIVAWVKLK